MVRSSRMLVAAAMRLAHGLRADPNDRLLFGAFAGLSAFVGTWLTSHPMLVQEVAFPFWILLGAAIARADGDAQPPFADLKACATRDVAQPAFRATL